MDQSSSGNNSNKESFLITLGSKESKIKIGKVLDEVNYSNSQMVNDGKNFCLYEKKPGKGDVKYISTSLAEQTSKYLLFKYNESTRILEAYPVNEWYSFKKEILLAQTLTLEEIEEKMKPQASIINNLFKKKGAIEPKKGKRKKTGNQKKGSGGREGEPELLDELPPEKEEPPHKDDERSIDSEFDPELKDMPSDIEEGLQQTKKMSLIEKTLASQKDPPKSVDESEDSFDVDNNDLDDFSEDFDNAASEINEEEVDKGMAQAQLGLIGLKRRRDDEGNEGKKVRSVYSEMEESLENMLARNKQMTYEKIAKEMAKKYSTSNIEMYLKVVLDKNTKMFNQGNETFYFNKLSN